MSPPNSHDAQLPQLIQGLENLHSEMLNLANDNLPALLHIHKDHQASAGNLLHYLALRRHDIRELQERLASMGLSSLGRTEGHALGGLRTVVGVLSRLNQAASAAGVPLIPVGADCRPSVFERHKWDDARNPLPYGRIAVACVEPLLFPSFEDAASLESARQQLQDALDRAADQARAALGFEAARFPEARRDESTQGSSGHGLRPWGLLEWRWATLPAIGRRNCGLAW
jgi:hypothetical protein